MLKILGSLLVSLLSFPALAASPYLIKDLTPGNAISLVAPLGPVGNSMLFTSGTFSFDMKLYRTDGTAAGTIALPSGTSARVGDGAAATFTWHGAPYVFTGTTLDRIDADGAHVVVNDARVCVVEDDAIYTLGISDYLERYDGTTNTTISKGSCDGLADYFGRPVVVAAGTLSIVQNGRMVPIRTFPTNISGPYVAGGFILFSGIDGWWRSDGTAAGTEQFTTAGGTEQFTTATGTSELNPVVAAGPRIFYRSSRGLMCTDGTDAGTRLAVDVPNATPELAFGDRMLYTNRDTAQTVRIGTTDGTLAGITLLKVLPIGATSAPPVSSFALFEGQVYFVAQTAPGARLWQTDGTPEGTKVTADTLQLHPGLVRQLQTLGNRLYFSADDGSTGAEMWALPVDFVNRLTINDVRTAQGQPVRFIVSLTHPLGSQVAVDYATRELTAIAATDFTPQAGTIVFQPGETQKEIAIGTLATGKHSNSVFRIQLSNPRGATIEHATGSALIEGPPPPADLVLTSAQITTPTPNSTITATVRNDGPSNVPDGAVTFGLILDAANNRPTVTIPPLAPSALSRPTSQLNLTGVMSNAVWFATVTSAADPNTTNNTLIGRLSMNGLGHIVSYAPVDLHPGDTASLHFSAPTMSGPTATSSNPAVATVGTLTLITSQFAVATLTAIAPGTTTITIDGTNIPIKVDVLGAGESSRLPSRIDCCKGISDNRAGITQLFTGSIPSRAPNGAEPTGSLTFTEEGANLGTLPISGQQFLVSLDLGRAGDHTVNIAYSGDATFEPATGSLTWRTNRGNPSIGLTPNAAGLTVTLNGTPRATPTGQITVSDDRHEVFSGTHAIVQTRAGSAASTFDAHLSPGTHSITIQYSGDANYLPVTVTYPLTVHTRAAGH